MTCKIYYIDFSCLTIVLPVKSQVILYCTYTPVKITEIWRAKSIFVDAMLPLFRTTYILHLAGYIARYLRTSRLFIWTCRTQNRPHKISNDEHVPTGCDSNASPNKFSKVRFNWNAYFILLQRKLGMQTLNRTGQPLGIRSSAVRNLSKRVSAVLEDALHILRITIFRAAEKL